MAPSKKGEISKGHRKVLISALRTRYRIRSLDAAKILPTAVEQWGKVRRLEGGDTMYARELVPDRQTSRDASFVRVRSESSKKLVCQLMISSVTSSKLSSIKTHSTDTVLKNSSPQHSLVSYCSSSSLLFLRRHCLEQRSNPRRYLLPLFGESSWRLRTPTLAPKSLFTYGRDNSKLWTLNACSASSVV
jgi:hypothetical protein